MIMKIKSIIYVFMFVIIAAISVSLFWKNVFLLCVLLLVIAFIKHKIIPIKKELLFFVIGGLIGSSVESVIMLSGPWSYSLNSIINFPLWLPFLWGLAGTLGISLYQAITE